MRHVLRNPYHLWAHQSQDWARNSGDTMSFRGKEAYSYHAEIGRIVENAKGERAYLVSTDTWSVTTSRHQSDLRRSIPSYATVFNVLRVGLSHEAQVQHYLNEIEELAHKSKRARSNKPYIQDNCLNRLAELRRYVAFFGLKVKLPESNLETLAEDFERAREKAEQQRKRAQAKARKEAQEDIQRWLRNETTNCPFIEGEQFLRLKNDNHDIVETSLRAEVPLAEVLLALPMVLRVIRSGISWIPECPVRLGHYSLHSVSKDGTVRVGCHTFLKAEVLRFACYLGVCGE